MATKVHRRGNRGAGRGRRRSRHAQVRNGDAGLGRKVLLKIQQVPIETLKPYVAAVFCRIEVDADGMRLHNACDRPIAEPPACDIPTQCAEQSTKR